MMADWKKAVSGFAQDAVSKGRDSANILRYRLEISDLERKMKQIYRDLGEYLYYHTEALTDPDESVQTYFSDIREIQTMIGRMRASIEEIRLHGKCLRCGTSIKRGHLYCPMCGDPVTNERPLRLSNESNEIEIPGTQKLAVCRICGVVLEKDAVFCQNCGEKQE